MNSRDQYTGDFRRIMSFDYTGNLDATTQWASVHNNTLLDPECEGSMINYTTAAGKSVLLFSNPNSTTSRSTLGVRQSFDGGKTWTASYIYDSGIGAYSDIVILPNSCIGVLYEDGAVNEIRFNSFPYNTIPVQ